MYINIQLCVLHGGLFFPHFMMNNWAKLAHIHNMLPQCWWKINQKNFTKFTALQTKLSKNTLAFNKIDSNRIVLQGVTGQNEV